jgi:regulator of replication initiation timing
MLGNYSQQGTRVEREDLHRGAGEGMVHNEEELTLENEKLKEENKRLKHEMSCIKLTTNESLIEENKKLMLEKEHLKVGLRKFV